MIEASANDYQRKDNKMEKKNYYIRSDRINKYDELDRYGYLHQYAFSIIFKALSYSFLAIIKTLPF